MFCVKNSDSYELTTDVPVLAYPPIVPGSSHKHTDFTFICKISYMFPREWSNINQKLPSRRRSPLIVRATP